MAATLQGQWDAVYGPTIFDGMASDARKNAVWFVQRVSMAVSARAVAVSQEPPGGPPPNHANRVALAKAAMNDPNRFAVPFAQAMASQQMDQNSTDAAILSAVATGWDYMAGVP